MGALTAIEETGQVAATRVLGAALLDPRVFRDVLGDGNVFFRPSYGRLFDAVASAPAQAATKVPSPRLRYRMFAAP